MSTNDDRIAESRSEQLAHQKEASIEAQLLEPTDRDMAALLAALASPPEPNAAMLRSGQRWRGHGTTV